MRLPLRSVVIGLLLMLSTQFMARSAKASLTPGEALITVGIATASGAVLGLSTISFYSEPSKHMQNVLFGAALGAIAGVAADAYMIANDDQEEDIDPEELLVKPPVDKTKSKKGDEKQQDEEEKPKKKPAEDDSAMLLKGRRIRHARYAVSTSSASPVHLIGREWAVSARVLELRF